jgi:alpha-tubulin suppressor-like RCC1 family protein
VAAGSGHSAALRRDGTVWGWGMAFKGNFGDGTIGGYSKGIKEAKQARGPGGEGKLTGMKAISCIMTSTVGLRDDGTLWAWGTGSSGQLGNGGTTSSALPVQVKSPDGKGVFTDAVAVAAGQTHAAAVKADGTVWVWGLNDRGQLGGGSDVNLSALPMQVKTPDGRGFLRDIIGIAAGAGHCLALRKDGTVLAWGENVVGQLGDGTTTDRFLPVEVSGIAGIASVAAGWNSSFAVCRDGTVWGWGYNVFSQLGDGTAYDRRRPVRMKGPDGSGPMTGALRVASGSVHTLIVKKDGTLWACGGNHFGQLGTGNRRAREALPVQVTGPRGNGLLKGVTDAAAGSAHSAAVTADGAVYCWGDNVVRQIGDPAVPAVGCTIMNGELIDSARAKRKNLYDKGAVRGPGPLFPWPALLPSERAVPILNAMETIGSESGGRMKEATGHLADKEILVRIAAIRALGRIQGAADKIVPALAGMLDDEDRGVRMQSVRILGKCGAGAGVVSALGKALKDSDSNVAYAACRALGKFREAAAAAVPDLWAATKRGGALGSECYDSLAKIGGPAVDVLVRALQDPENSRGHVMCVIALGSMGPRAAPAVPVLIQALESKQEQVRQKAAKALGGIGPDAKPAMAALKKALNDESKAVRYNAKKALKRLEKK